MELELFIYKNIDFIFNNFIKVFNMNKEEIVATIKNLITIVKKDDFYSNYNKYFTSSFNIENLINLKRYLLNRGISEEDIKKTIIRTPGMILANSKLDSIYLIFKAKRYKGYVILNKEQIKSYIYLKNGDLLCGKNNNYYENDYMINDMLRNLNREDVRFLLNINKDYNTKETFNSLKEDFSLKNYYFKK